MEELSICKTGDLIRHFRKEKGLSQKELAKLTGLSIGTIQGYEQGRYKPKRKSLELISNQLQVPIEKLLGDDFSAVTLSRDYKEFISTFAGKNSSEEIVESLLEFMKSPWSAITEDERKKLEEQRKKELETELDRLIWEKIKSLPEKQRYALYTIIEGLASNSQDTAPDPDHQDTE